MSLEEKDLSRSLQIARAMQSIATNEYHLDPIQAQQFFVVGLLHLVGKEFEEGEDMAHTGGWVLRHMGFSCWKDIAYQDRSVTAHTSQISEALLRAKAIVEGGSNGLYQQNVFGSPS